jgi:hypothetical protein
VLKRVWIATYCPCIYESADGIIEVCATKKLAIQAKKEHKEKELKKRDSGKEWSFERWEVKHYKLRTE